MTGTIRLDLHVHSRYSPDSSTPLERIAEAASVAGLGGFAITDHNTVAGHAEIPALTRAFPRLLIVPGVEVSTREGHLLVYGVSEAPIPRRPLNETLEEVGRRGGVGVLAHPYRWAHGVGDVLARTAAVRGVEAFNGHNSRVANARAELVAASRRLASTGGSDAHRPRDVGRGFTEISDRITTAAEVVAEIAKGNGIGRGENLRTSERLWLAVSTGARRAARGFRPI